MSESVVRSSAIVTVGGMRTLGIIGGIAPPSTADYYRLLIAGYREQTRDGTYPSILINSIDLARLLRLVDTGRLAELTDWLAQEIERLARAGAEIALLASNTPHLVFDELAAKVSIPLLSIVEAASDAAAEMGLGTVGLLGTSSTMKGKFYPEVFARRGIAVLPPSPDDQSYVHERYIEELVAGAFRAETRDRFLAIVERLAEDGAQGVLLAGTELPLLLRDVGCRVPLLDTTRIHVRCAVAALLGHRLDRH